VYEVLAVPMPDDGFMKKQKHGPFWTIKDIVENAVVIDCPSVSLFVHHRGMSDSRIKL
jgi:hypothetical protein